MGSRHSSTAPRRSGSADSCWTPGFILRSAPEYPVRSAVVYPIASAMILMGCLESSCMAFAILPDNMYVREKCELVSIFQVNLTAGGATRWLTAVKRGGIEIACCYAGSFPRWSRRAPTASCPRPAGILACDLWPTLVSRRFQEAVMRRITFDASTQKLIDHRMNVLTTSRGENLS